MLHLSPLYQIDQGFNILGCENVSVLTVFHAIFGFSVLDDFFSTVLRFLTGLDDPLLTQLIKPNYLVILNPTDIAPQFRNSPPLVICL